MHSLAVLDELPQQLGNDLIALAHLELHFFLPSVAADNGSAAVAIIAKR